ncbi:MAG: rod shape-determining protein MreC [Congregibacter sp.]|nr:rod shape-determining protein MreC [Congregibacter sp.]MDP5070350.1 rod shape-determining protein MreC [Congregibacter sp.]
MGAAIKPLFIQESNLGLRFVLGLLLAGILLLADLRYSGLANLRSAVDTALTPIYMIANIPSALDAWQDNNIRSRQRLLEDNDRLRRENLVLQGRSQQLSSMQADNARLRALLNSTALLRDDVLVSEIIGVSPDPVRHQLVLDKGAEAEVYLGQPLIDSQGLMGQVVEVGLTTSRVLLITDPTHSVPVQVNRNGVRAVAEGMGSLDQLAVHHVTATTDIQVGDLLVTSGLGGRFPIGYPVASVSAVERNPGEAFAQITATPTAALDRARHVLLVFSRTPVLRPPLAAPEAAGE